MSLTEQFTADFIKSYLKVVAEKATTDLPLHRAKAMKWAINTKEEFNKQVNKHARQDYWTLTKDEGWVTTDDMGYITGLTDKAKDFLNA